MIERLAVDEWPRFRAVRLAALLDTPDAFGSTHDREVAFGPGEWQARLSRPRTATLLAVVGGRDIGTMVVTPSVDDPEVAAIYGVWVAPEGRRRGIGDAMMSEALAAAREFGFPRVALGVGDHNAVAQALYARHGFTRTGDTSTLPPPREHVTEHELARDLDQTGSIGPVGSSGPVESGPGGGGASPGE